MKAGMPKVSYPGGHHQNATPGAGSQVPDDLEPIGGGPEDIAQYPKPYTFQEVPVCVKGIVSVRIIPAKRASHETFFPLTLTQIQAGAGLGPSLIQPKDGRVRSFILSVQTQDVYIGTKEQLIQGTPNGFYIKAGASLPPFEGCDDDLWAIAVTAGASVSVRRQYGAD